MAEIDRDEAERELVRLLKRSLKVVHLLRFDKSDEVIAKFKVACDLLESNLVSDYSASELEAAEKSENEDFLLSRPQSGSRSSGSKKRAPYGEHSDEEEEEPGKDEKVEKEPSFVPKKISLDAARRVTTDYSSPSLGKRSLGADPAVAAAANLPPQKSRAPIPSSRAQGAAGAAVANVVPRSGSSIGSSGSSSSSDRGLPKGSAVPVRADDLRKQIPKPLTQDFASPRLGGRGLTKDKILDRKDELVLPELDDTGQPQDEEMRPVASAKSLKALPDPLAKVFSGPKHEHPAILEAPHSPLQLNASRRLLELSGGAKVEATSSPKPGFLRRLDSPHTHSGILLTKRKQLSKMIRRAVASVPYVKLEAYAQIKAALTEAVVALEASTTKDSSP